MNALGAVALGAPIGAQYVSPRSFSLSFLILFFLFMEVLYVTTLLHGDSRIF